jgi:hypothetical protein
MRPSPNLSFSHNHLREKPNLARTAADALNAFVHRAVTQNEKETSSTAAPLLLPGIGRGFSAFCLLR